MTNRLFNVLDGIVDSSNDYTDEIINDIKSIIDYADSCSESITEEEAKKIQIVGKKWINDQDNGNGEWSRMRHEAIASLEDE